MHVRMYMYMHVRMHVRTDVHQKKEALIIWAKPADCTILQHAHVLTCSFHVYLTHLRGIHIKDTNFVDIRHFHSPG